jgi:hypothetical protein
MADRYENFRYDPKSGRLYAKVTVSSASASDLDQVLGTDEGDGGV